MPRVGLSIELLVRCELERFSAQQVHTMYHVYRMLLCFLSGVAATMLYCKLVPLTWRDETSIKVPRESCTGSEDGNTAGPNVAQDLVQSAWADSRSIDVGRTELEQYFRLAELKRKPSPLSGDGYTFNVTMVDDVPTTEGIFIKIDEYRDGRSTNGGSGFRIISAHVSADLCPFRDVYNGTYFAWCPPMVFGERRDITVTLEYVNFAAYISDRPTSFNRLIWHTLVRLDMWNRHKIRKPQPLTQPSVAAALVNYTDFDSLVSWYNDNERWVVRIASGKQFFSLDTRGMCECVKRMGRLVMVGASHMRYKYSYVVQQCYNQTGVGLDAKDDAFGNIHYKRIHFVRDFRAFLDTDVGRVSFGPTDLLLVQTGAFDIARNGLRSLITKSIDRYIDTLKYIRNMTHILSSNLVVVTQPPFPFHQTGIQEDGDRNCFCIAAYTRLLKEKLLLNRFNVFDEFSILRPQSEKNICNSHYVCPMYDGNTYGVYGDVGVTAARLLMSHVCRSQTHQRVC